VAVLPWALLQGAGALTGIEVSRSREGARVVTEWEGVFVSAAMAGAKNCIHVFEAEQSTDDKPKEGVGSRPTVAPSTNRLGKIISCWNGSCWNGSKSPFGEDQRIGRMAAEPCALAATFAHYPLTLATARD
jgi:hypothetical protein